MTTHQTFSFRIEADVDLTLDELWPDGDAPDNPTVDDVIAIVERTPSLHRMLNDWNLMDLLELSIDGRRVDW